MKLKKPEPIKTIKKRYHREWLLVAVKEMDESTTTPISGRLISHSPHRDEIYQKLLKLPKRENILIEYSDDSLPKGFAAAF